MASNAVLRCDRTGLGETLEATLLGGYDGFGLWRIMLDNIAGGDEHLVVQVHEALHHELQTSTLWGCLGAMSAAIAHTGLRPLALRDVFDRVVSQSTAVHEVYATFMSDVIARPRLQGVDVLKGNTRYQTYRQRGEALVPLVQGAENLHAPAVAAVLRTCMQPAGLAGLLARLNFTTLTAEDLTAAVTLGPDARLSALEDNPPDLGEWRRLLQDLAQDDPGHQAQILTERRSTTQADLPQLTEQWLYETDVVQRQCYSLAAQALLTAGHSTILWDELGAFTATIINAAISAAPELANVVGGGDELALGSPGDLLEFSRQGIELRAPLPLEQLPVSVLEPDLLEAFVVQADTPEEHACALWTTSRELSRQFEVTSPLEPGAIAHGVLFTRARDAAGPVARVGLLPPQTRPNDLRAAVHPRPLLVVATQSAVASDEVAEALATVEPVFVLMDLPIGWHVDRWIGQGATVRLAVGTVDPEKEIVMLACAIDLAPAFRLFHVGGQLAIGALLERLRQRHDPKSLVHDQHDLTGFTLAVSHVMHTFSVLDQDGAA